jgi:signal transduction histidine kinase
VSLIEINEFLYWPQAGLLYPFYIGLLYIGFYILTIIELVKSISKTTHSSKQRKILILILVAFSVSLAAGATNFPLWFGVNLNPYGNFILIFVYVFLLAYAMIKYNLMSVKYFAADMIMVVLNIVAFSSIFISDTKIDYIVNTIFFLGVAGISVVLKKSFNQEIIQKEQLEKSTIEIKRANKELKKLDKAKSEFISIASHQLRTPLTAIKGYISLILEGAYGKNSPETEAALNKVFLANERIIQLVEDLLNITRIESGRLEYHYDDNIQIEEILETLKDTFILRTKEKNLEFKIQTPDKKLPPIKADKSKLTEVISNLIDNAIKYTDKGYVHVIAQEKRKFIRITIKDSGVGISKDSLKSLFTKFSRGTDNTKLYTEGTGLGLYVGKNLIEEQGGRVYAKSDGPGKGSEFIVEMPIQ